jgi:hypothetical protein
VRRSIALPAVLALAIAAGCTLAPSARPSLDGQVVDTEPPTFNDPTAISNALFPAATVTQLVHLGVDGGAPLRVEVTRMPETRVIAWEGMEVETVVVQFISYRDGRILEVAYDFFAQADDGSVWYFGETVDNYADGRVSNHSGAWLAGEDGPPGMIMPAEPEVGDIYHPENIPGVVFEELIVLETDVSVPGPSGEITGAIRVEEHLMEGTVEQKIFAPGYGEFHADAPNELVTVAVAAPTDARPGPMPPDLVALHDASATLVASAMDPGPDAGAVLADMRARWEALRGDAPPLLVEATDAALETLESAGGGSDGGAFRAAALDMHLAILDLGMPYRVPASIDVDRMAVWLSRLALDAGRAERAAAVGHAAVTAVVWARAAAGVPADARGRIDPLVTALAQAAEAGDLDALGRVAAELVGALPTDGEP